MNKTVSHVVAATPEAVGRALALGNVAILASREVADRCGAYVEDCLSYEDAWEAFLRPYGDGEPPEDAYASREAEDGPGRGGSAPGGG